MNPYQVLGIDKSASEDEVKKAYREKVKKHHPDQGGDEDKFREVKEAYEQITSDSSSSTEPFSGHSTYTGQPNTGPEPRDINDFEDIFERFNEWAREGGFNQKGFQGDPFGQSVGQAGPSPHGQGKQRSRGPLKKIDIPFRTAVLGGDVTIQTGPNVKKTIDIPVGVENGQQIRAGQDIYEVSVTNNTPYWRENKNDIYLEKDISVWEAMIGKEIPIETIDGKKIMIDIDPGTSDEEVYRLPEMGGPPTIEKPKGDMYVETNINIPAITDEETQEVIESNFIEEDTT